MRFASLGYTVDGCLEFALNIAFSILDDNIDRRPIMKTFANYLSHMDSFHLHTISFNRQY